MNQHEQRPFVISSWARPAVQLMASANIVIAAVALLGYATHATMFYTWMSYGVPGMAVNTAICHILVGLCLLIITHRERQPFLAKDAVESAVRGAVKSITPGIVDGMVKDVVKDVSVDPYMRNP